MAKQLTQKQINFCHKYIECGNASEAYRFAYNAENMKQESIAVNASKLLSDANVALYVNKLRDEINKDVIRRRSIEITELAKEALDSIVDYVDDINEWVSAIIRNEAYNLTNGKKTEFRKRSINSVVRYSVLERAGFKCQACGVKPLPDNDIVLHIDHIIPFSFGGTNIASNLQVLCESCNISKGNKYGHDHNE